MRTNALIFTFLCGTYLNVHKTFLDIKCACPKTQYKYVIMFSSLNIVLLVVTFELCSVHATRHVHHQARHKFDSLQSCKRTQTAQDGLKVVWIWSFQMLSFVTKCLVHCKYQCMPQTLSTIVFVCSDHIGVPHRIGCGRSNFCVPNLQSVCCDRSGRGCLNSVRYSHYRNGVCHQTSSSYPLLCILRLH